MPEEDIEEAQLVWEQTKSLIKKGDYSHFPRMTDSIVAHVRPKGKDGDDLMETPQGSFEKKKCFWLNRTYIINHIVNA